MMAVETQYSGNDPCEYVIHLPLWPGQGDRFRPIDWLQECAGPSWTQLRIASCQIAFSPTNLSEWVAAAPECTTVIQAYNYFCFSEFYQKPGISHSYTTGVAWGKSSFFLLLVVLCTTQRTRRKLSCCDPKGGKDPALGGQLRFHLFQASWAAFLFAPESSKRPLCLSNLSSVPFALLFVSLSRILHSPGFTL